MTADCADLADTAGLLIRVRQTPSAFFRVHNETLAVVAMRVRDKGV
jgi:hypothetical protein